MEKYESLNFHCSYYFYDS